MLYFSFNVNVTVNRMRLRVKGGKLIAWENLNDGLDGIFVIKNAMYVHKINNSIIIKDF